MTVTLFGASGKVGRLVVERLLQDGHTVVAFVHSSPRFREHPRLTVIQGDVHNTDDVTHAIQGSDAVISTLGSWHTREKNILSSAMERVIAAMQDKHIKRIVTLTGVGAFSVDDTPSPFDHAQHALFNAFAPKVLRDAEEHILLLSESGLDWTVVRSPRMNESGTNKYKLGNHVPLPWVSIHRQAVADCIVSQLTDTSHYHDAPFITRA